MGVNCGFDMVPRLADSPPDRVRWAAFIAEIHMEFGNDTVVEFDSQVVAFKVGEHPCLPIEGHRFLRFSSKITNRGPPATPHILQVYKIAHKHFNDQAQWWHEGTDQHGHYDWHQVHASIKSCRDQDLNLNVDRTNAGLSALQADEIPCYNAQSLPGKGLGLIAARDIPKGRRILSEAPLFTISSVWGAEDMMIAQELRKLDKEKQRMFFNLHNCHRGELAPFHGIVRTNALPLGPGATKAGIFPIASRINHACLPSCQHSFNTKLGKETIHAVRDIREGEEITIIYADTEPSSERRRHLREKFKFDCMCSVCTMPPDDLERSDKRQEDIRQLDEMVGDAMHLYNSPKDHLELVHKLMSALGEEGITDARVPRAYYDAFQTAISHGDKLRAKVFAERAYTTRLCCEGDDSENTIRMKQLMMSPESHPSYAAAGKIRKGNRIPKDLSDDDFERWLWKW